MTRVLSPNRRTVVCAATAATLAALAYLNTLTNPFVYDDTSEIVDNPSIVGLGNLVTVLRYQLTRPLTNLSYAIDYAGWGLNPVGYHLTNLLLHALNVALFFVVMRRVVSDSRPDSREEDDRLSTLVAFLAATLFAVHPMMTEGVGYVSSRAELLAGVFFFAALLAFRRALLTLSFRWIAAGGATFLLAVAAKETAAMLPLLVIAYDWCLLPADGDRRRRRFWRLHAPILGVMATLGGLRVWRYVTVEQAAAAGVSWPNLLVDVHVAARYISLLVVPTSLSIVQAVSPIRSLTDPSLLSAIAVLAMVVAAGWYARRTEPVVLFGLLWFFLLLVPSSALIVVADRGQPMAEHRVYLASCGFFAAIAAFAVHWVAGLRSATVRRVAWVAFAGVLAILFSLTILRNRVWSDPVTLWADAAGKAPRVWMAQYGLADTLRLVGDCDSALAPYQRAIRLRPDAERGYMGLARCLQETEHPDDAKQVLRLAITRVRPPSPDIVLALATLEEITNNPREALRLCNEVLRFPERAAQAAACVQRNAKVGVKGP